MTNRVQKNVTVEIQKKWEGDEENKRPENVEIVLKRNGEEIITSSLTAEDDWKIASAAGGFVDVKDNMIIYTDTIEWDKGQNRRRTRIISGSDGKK